LIFTTGQNTPGNSHSAAITELPFLRLCHLFPQPFTCGRNSLPTTPEDRCACPVQEILALSSKGAFNTQGALNTQEKDETQLCIDREKETGWIRTRFYHIF
jgi:hypothetical protein